MKTYTLSCEGMDDREIKVQDGDMIVYDVCKIKDYEGGDYVSRKAKDMDHVVPPIGRQDQIDKEAGELFEDISKGGL